MKLAEKIRNEQNGNGARTAGPGCGPMPGTVPQSWGSACPPGDCSQSAEEFLAAIGRSPRYNCREIPYWTEATADANGVATFRSNADITIAPTRIEAVSPDQAGRLTVFKMGNQNEIVGDGLPLRVISPLAYAVIPFVTDGLKAGLPWTWTVTGLAEGDVVRLGLFGPGIG